MGFQSTVGRMPCLQVFWLVFTFFEKEKGLSGFTEKALNKLHIIRRSIVDIVGVDLLDVK